MSSTQSPARLSPLHHTHIALGARITNIDGWQLPECRLL